MKSKMTLFIVNFALWMLLGWPFDAQHALVGIFAAGFVVFLSGDLFAGKKPHFGPLSRYLWFGYYIVLFLRECLKANIDVILRVIHPRLPIHPGIVKVKTMLRSDTALTLLANSITLAPGTFCVDINSQKGFLYVHWLDVPSQDAEKTAQLMADKFERVLKKIFEPEIK